MNMSTTITPDEAIKLLGMAVPMTAVTQQGFERFLQARKMAIDALKKQIPMKAVGTHYNGKAEVVDDYHFCRDGERREDELQKTSNGE